jgi:hypothetical protein
MQSKPQRTSVKKSYTYCVCCERPLNPKLLPIHHEGKEKKKVPMCAKCHWALHYGSLEVRKQMKKKIHAWLKKQQNE